MHIYPVPIDMYSLTILLSQIHTSWHSLNFTRGSLRKNENMYPRKSSILKTASSALIKLDIYKMIILLKFDKFKQYETR